MSTKSWYDVTPQGIIIHLKIQPRASSTQVVGLHGDPPRLKVRLGAPPVDGKANEELFSFLKKKLKITLNQMNLIRGETSPLKDVLCMGVTESQVVALLQK